MTAPETRPRLEAHGLWRESAAAPPREVRVVLGARTLMLRGENGVPLDHWALAGTRAIGTNDGVFRFAILDGEQETLEIRDPEMARAISSFARDFHAPRQVPPPSRTRLSLSGLALVALAALVVWRGPELARAQAARMLPPAQAREFGDRMLIAILEDHGPLCGEPDGARALAGFGARVAPAANLRVLDLGGAALVAALPGPTILIDRGALARATGPAELAGWIAQALGPAPGDAHARALMESISLPAALAYVFRGWLSEAALDRAAEAALAPPASPDSVDRPTSADDFPAADWQALRGICDVAAEPGAPATP